MKNFKNYSRYITKNRIKLSINTDELKQQFEATKEDRLLEGILSGKYANDEEAARDLYQTTPADKAFKMLKSRIKDRLISHFFQVDIKKTVSSSYSQKLTLTHKQLTAGQLLLNAGLSKEGREILKHGLSIAQYCQASGLIIFAARLLRSQAGFVGTRREVEKYNRLIETNLPIYAAELESDSMRDNLNIDFRETFSPQHHEKITRFWNRILELNDLFDNLVLKINKARIGSKYYETMGDFRGIIRVCDEAENYLLTHPKYYEKVRHRELASTKIEACLLLKDYKLGRENAEVCMSLHNTTSINAVIVLEYYVLLCMHDRDYVKAWELFDFALTMPAFKNYEQERLEKWKLFEAYLGFAMPRSDRKFKLFKFLNEVTVYSKDKRGLNVSIMIAQIILLLEDARFDLLLDKAESFKIYFKRYVTRHINYRTFYFVKMLETMFRYNFHYEKTKEVSAKFFNRLGDKEGHYHGDVESLEVIPYEELWNQIMKRLERHRDTFTDPGKIKLKRRRKKKGSQAFSPEPE